MSEMWCSFHNDWLDDCIRDPITFAEEQTVYEPDWAPV
jgi:hypothetical protein